MYGGTERIKLIPYSIERDIFITNINQQPCDQPACADSEVDGVQKLLGEGLNFVFSYDCNIQLRNLYTCL